MTGIKFALVLFLGVACLVHGQGHHQVNSGEDVQEEEHLQQQIPSRHHDYLSHGSVNPSAFHHRRHGAVEDADPLIASGSGHHGGHHGRVQIKVYRGQSKQHGYDYFAPYGYWVRQPPDNHGWGWGH